MIYAANKNVKTISYLCSSFYPFGSRGNVDAIGG